MYVITCDWPVYRSKFKEKMTVTVYDLHEMNTSAMLDRCTEKMVGTGRANGHFGLVESTQYCATFSRMKSHRRCYSVFVVGGVF